MLARIPLPASCTPLVAARLPYFFFGPPAPLALAARQVWREQVKLPAGFCGRVGLLVTQEADGSLSAWTAAQPLEVTPDPAPGKPYPKASDLVRPCAREVFADQARAQVLYNGQGEGQTLLALVEQFLAGKPEKIARGGGAGLQLTREHAYWSWLVGLKAPAVALLRHLNALNARTPSALQPLSYLEWWVGESPTWDIKFDGMPLSPRTTLKPLIEWLLTGYAVGQDPRKTEPAWQNKTPRILQATPDYVAVVKPSGLLTVPGTQGLPNALELTQQAVGGTLTAVHRLDADTSGLVLFARSPVGVTSLMAAFRERRVHKEYQALLAGSVHDEEGKIDLPLTTNPLDRLRQVVAEGGRESVTLYRKEGLWKTDAGRPRTLVRFYPLTGRTHQLRVHAAHPLGLGAPIVGDPYYSPQGLAAETPTCPLCLHAALIAFPDPQTGAMVTLQAPADRAAWQDR